MSDSDDLTLTLTPPPAATYYAGAPFYRREPRREQAEALAEYLAGVSVR